MAKQYTVNEVYRSIQGEGMRAGTVNVFCRFTGCNMRCEEEAGERSPGGFDCDTEFESGRKMTCDELVSWIKQEAGNCRWVIFTGGEPGLQVDTELCLNLEAQGFKLAIETNGSIDLGMVAPLHWITVSPKVAEHCIRQKIANEVKYVRGFGQGIPKTVVGAKYKLISPAFDGMITAQRTVDWCRQLIEENPEWRLSIQMHKIWQMR